MTESGKSTLNLKVTPIRNVFEQVEEPIISFWKKNQIFEKSVESRPKENSYVFYDGPPFVTGTPHYGSLLSSILKDVVPRYQTMKGKRVERRWGWDCHGLPIEEKVERKLGTKSRREIEQKVGIKKFIEECRTYVKDTSDAWPWYIDHVGRWVDMDNPYRTMDKDYMESVMWVFQQIYNKGLIYHGKRISLYCPRCGTPVSRFEIQMDNSYKELEDPSVFVKFPLNYYKTGVGVGVVIENDKGEILMAVRNEEGRKKLYGIVGGKMDTTDKDIVETVKREVKEEIGADVVDIEYYGFSIDVFEGRLFKTHHVKAKINGEPYNANDELSKLEWIKKEDIPWDNIHIPTKNCLKDVLENEPMDIAPELDLDGGRDKPPVYLLVWTTTPWTLPENVAVVVDVKAKYVTVLFEGEYYILAKERLAHVFSEDQDYEIIDEYSGEELLHLSYEPLFPYFKDKATDKDFKVYSADFVSMEEGTGLVHMAPAYGEDDFNLRKELGISIFEAIDDEGKFSDPVSDFKGLYFKDADKVIMENLRSRGLLFKQETTVHNYPICWRCGTPLLYKAQESWYVDIQSIKDQLLKNNENINWVPEHLKHGLFEHVLKTAPDWGISRTRYWATPMPVWKCNNCDNIEVLGSIDEIEGKSGKKVTDLHRPYIDEHTWKCEKCGTGTMQRIPEVVDVWLESGAMPYAQYHYPFENKEEFDHNFPGDFIVEYIAQTRAWFNILHRVSTIVSGTNAFKNVVATGVIKGTDGRKMSKSFGNYPDPKATLEKYGGEALRLYLVRSPVVVGENLNISEEGIRDQLKEIIFPFLNIYKYLATYLNQNGFSYNKDFVPTHVIDQWVMSRVYQSIKTIDEHLKAYYINKAASEIKPLIEDVSTWYIRRSRDRFVAGDQEALQTLFHVVLLLIKVFAPFMPFSTEYIYQEVKKMLPANLQNESVHLELWPETRDELIKPDIMQKMQTIRLLASLGQKVRVENQLPLKQPLSVVKVVTHENLPAEYLDLLKQELNVLEVSQVDSLKELPDYYKVESNDDVKLALNIQVDRMLLKQRLMRELIRGVQVARRQSNLNIGELAKANLYFIDPIIQEVVDESYQLISDKTSLAEIITEQRSSLEDLEQEQGLYSFTVGQSKIPVVLKITREQ